MLPYPCPSNYPILGTPLSVWVTAQAMKHSVKGRRCTEPVCVHIYAHGMCTCAFCGAVLSEQLLDAFFQVILYNTH